MFNTQDTIAAISSAAGTAQRAIVRLSGPRAIALAGQCFSEDLSALPGFRAISGVVRMGTNQTIELPGRVYLFRAPRSYTRQDVVELHVSGELPARLLLEDLLGAGARQATAGEFTARAFFSGRLDLAKAQAVADIIDAEADVQLRSAVGVLGGELTRLCDPAAAALTEALALTEASIDFAEENVELDSPAELARRIARSADGLQNVLANCGTWVSSSSQPHVAITGRPNAGKSSLLNVLSGMDRAIVSSVAGTTRDVLSAPAILAGGAEAILLDAAGLEESDDPLWRMAHQAARQAVTAADAVLFVIDASRDDYLAELELFAQVEALRGRAGRLVLAAKADLLGPADPRWARLAELFGPEVIPVSAVSGQGLDELRQALAQRLRTSAMPQGGQLLLHGRQRRGIAAAVAAARRAGALLAAAKQISDVAELAAVELRQCLSCLREITGQVVSEDILSAIFARFCIGK